MNSQSSAGRYGRKRNSYEVIKTSFSLKNAKKSLPQVSIELNQPIKKNRLALQNKEVKNEYIYEISQSDDYRKSMNKTCKKKDQIVLKNLYNTKVFRLQDQNKNSMNKEIDILKSINLQLKQENQRCRKNEEYYCRRMKQMKEEKKQQQQKTKQYVETLQNRLHHYSIKIKKLYEQLIFLKKKNNEKQEQYSEKNSGKGELYSYRIPNSQKTYEKRLTSPSPPQNHLWGDEVHTFLQIQKKGQKAFYLKEKKYTESLRSSLQY